VLNTAWKHHFTGQGKIDGKEFNLMVASTQDDAIVKIQSNNIDFVIVDNAVGLNIHKETLSYIKKLGKNLPYFFVLSDMASIDSVMLLKTYADLVLDVQNPDLPLIGAQIESFDRRSRSEYHYGSSLYKKGLISKNDTGKKFWFDDQQLFKICSTQNCDKRNSSRFGGNNNTTRLLNLYLDNQGMPIDPMKTGIKKTGQLTNHIQYTIANKIKEMFKIDLEKCHEISIEIFSIDKGHYTYNPDLDIVWLKKQVDEIKSVSKNSNSARIDSQSKKSPPLKGKDKVKLTTNNPES
jgi:hypothetical protein